MTRVCEWCGGPLKPDAPANAVTCSDAHRALRWRWLNGIPRGRGRPPQPPPPGSPLLAGKQPAPMPRRTRRSRSGLQLSWAKAVDALAAWMGEDRERAESVLKPALSDRQRERLEARDAD